MLQKWYETIAFDFDFQDVLGVLCVGSCEQHSEYLPVGTDGLLGTVLCQEAAKLAKTKVLLLPTQQIGFSPHHRAFKGYITLSQDTMFHYLTELCLCAYENGLNKLLIVNAHGGNQSCLQTVVNELGSVYKKHALLVRYWDLIGDKVNEIRQSGSGGMGHAGEFETSLMLHFYPELVKRAKFFNREAAKGNKYHDPDMFAKNMVYIYKNFDEYSEKGNIGQPQYATAEKGKLFGEYAIKALSELMDYYAANDF
jgi:creatinine amidohydrolase